MILLVTNERDLTTDYIVLELQRRQISFVRLNTETVSSGVLSFTPAHGWCFRGRDASVNFATVAAAYYRRPGSPRAVGSFLNQFDRRYCESEWNATLAAALSSLQGKWLNSPQAIANAENKPRQLNAAVAAGFAIPETLLTNCFEDAQAFVADGPTVCKPIRTALIGEANDERVIFTTRISNLDRNAADSVACCPVILQREVKKYCDIRATVVGRQVFAAEIHSQGREETETDWRKGSHIDLPHRIHELPSEVSDRCIAITRTMGLNFGAVDLVLDLSGQYWFLEINPNGQWAWIENRTGLHIARAIVEELERIADDKR